MTSKRYLFYIAHNYSFEILRPLQKVMLAQGDQVKWLAIGKEVTTSYFHEDESVLACIDDARAYNPEATFAPGNEIPNFIPGLKIQVFHGLEWKKKGHFVIRDFFDLYCTHGPATTSRFNQLAQKHGYFDVVETGWPKLDELFTTEKMALTNNDKPIILYAPTFSPALTSAPELFEQIKQLAETKQHHWLIKFHPKMAQQWLDKYQTLVSDNVEIIESSSIAQLLQTADIMVSDTSSVIGEFALLNKPIVSLNNKAPGDYLIDIDNASKLVPAIEQALSASSELKKAIKKAIKNYADDLHPYQDGQAAQRILSATENILKNGKKASNNKPLNLFRNFKQRKKLSYWRFI